MTAKIFGVYDDCEELFKSNHLFPSYFNKFMVQSCVMIVLTMYQKLKSYEAKSGNKDAGSATFMTSDMLVLGIYEQVFWFILGTTCLSAAALYYYGNGGSGSTGIPSSITALNWSVHHFGYEGVTFLLLHSGVGKRARNNSLVLAAAWGAFTFVSVFLVYFWGGDMDVVVARPGDDKGTDTIVLSTSYTVLLAVFYGALVVLPESIVYQRPALFHYALYWLIYELVTFLDQVLSVWYDPPFCVEAGNKWIMFSLTYPFVLMHTLRADCLYWQGQYTTGDDSLNAPLLAVGNYDRDIMESIATDVADGKAVKHVPFGMVSFQDKNIYSAGASARVYKGYLKNKSSPNSREVVAIKMLFRMELNTDAIQRFGQEVQLLNSLKHPNIVTCKGICIMPPALCLLTEFCGHGSLYEFLYNSKSSVSLYRSLSWNRKLSMIIEAVRGVEYLHSKGFIHGDIKSLNFLVTESMIVKLSDLGEHRLIRAAVDRDNPLPKSKNWSPPEILLDLYGPTYCPSSDIYSLGMVISEILIAKVPFDDRDDPSLKRISLTDLGDFLCDERNRPKLLNVAKVPSPSPSPAPLLPSSQAVGAADVPPGDKFAERGASNERISVIKPALHAGKSAASTMASANISPAVVSIVERSWCTDRTQRCTASYLLDHFLECYSCGVKKVNFRQMDSVIIEKPSDSRTASLSIDDIDLERGEETRVSAPEVDEEELLLLGSSDADIGTTRDTIVPRSSKDD